MMKMIEVHKVQAIKGDSKIRRRGEMNGNTMRYRSNYIGGEALIRRGHTHALVNYTRPAR